MPFFFPNEMLKRAVGVYGSLIEEVEEMELFNSAISAAKALEYEEQRYLGFGFLLSFIPCTDAFRARRNLSAEVDEMISETREKLEHPNLKLIFSWEERYLSNNHQFYRWAAHSALNSILY